jgi:hypothetical protein
LEQIAVGFAQHARADIEFAVAFAGLIEQLAAKADNARADQANVARIAIGFDLDPLVGRVPAFAIAQPRGPLIDQPARNAAVEGQVDQRSA